LTATGWRSDEIDRTFCHQVGKAHRKLLLDELQLRPESDFGTFEFLGNTGSAALPITAAMGIEQGLTKPGDRIGLLGIGSGINVVMLGVEWASGR
jgi:3-oxoacyl-[acyl-carrier-protein] synthase-3